MSILMTLAKKHQFKGIYTQRKILWGIIETLEGRTPSVNIDPIETLIIQSDNGKIVSNTGSNKYYTKCTYANLCSCMRDNIKIALHNATTFEPIYGIWQSEPNVPFNQDEIEENKEDNV